MNDKILRQHVIKLLDGHEAHADWKQALAGLPAKLRGEHVSPDWPSGYWPASGKTPSDRDWKSCLRKFAADAAAMKKLVARSKTDLTAKIPHGTGQTVLREALLLADHNSYHVGQIALVRRLLGDWPKS